MLNFSVFSNDLSIRMNDTSIEKERVKTKNMEVGDHEHSLYLAL